MILAHISPRSVVQLVSTKQKTWTIINVQGSKLMDDLRFLNLLRLEAKISNQLLRGADHGRGWWSVILGFNGYNAISTEQRVVSCPTRSNRSLLIVMSWMYTCRLQIPELISIQLSWFMTAFSFSYSEVFLWIRRVAWSCRHLVLHWKLKTTGGNCSPQKRAT